MWWSLMLNKSGEMEKLSRLIIEKKVVMLCD